MKSQFNTTVVVIDVDELLSQLQQALNQWLIGADTELIKTFRRSAWLQWLIQEALERYYYLYSQHHYQNDLNQKIFQAIDQRFPKGLGNVFYTYLPPCLLPCADRVERFQLTPWSLTVWVENTESL